jgi:dTDP-4-dehydrorhamnose reductase
MVTGGSGFLGWNLCTGLRKRYEVFGSYLHHSFTLDNCYPFKLDLTSQGEIQRCIEQIRPDVIIHTAAITNPDQCEKNRELAEMVNVSGTKSIARCAQTSSFRLIYISTDLVFNGEKGFYHEEDQPDPVNYYGETKLRGENTVKELLPDSVIVRVSLMYGWGNGMNGCFTDWMLNTLKKKEKLNLFIDQYRTPTLVNDTVSGLEKIVEDPQSTGTFHLAGPERVSRLEFGKFFVDTFGFSPDLIRPVKQDEISSLVRRPKDSSLSIQKFQERYSFTPKGVREGIQAMYEMQNIKF